jgi:phosphatidylinositol alpha-1,6-mannosyltransferase
MSPRIRESVERLGLQERVRVLGRVSEEMLLTLFRGSDLFVMPNVPVPGDIEGFGVVMLEAGLCGLPIVAADLEGIRDVVREGENGVLLPAGSPEPFAAAIEGFRSDRAALRQASEAALRSTLDRFAWDVVVEQYVEALGAARAGAEGR